MVADSSKFHESWDCRTVFTPWRISIRARIPWRDEPERRDVFPLDDPTSLSRLYHLNSEPWLNDDAYRSTAANQETKRLDDVLATVELPAAAPTEVSQLIARRESVRAYVRARLSLDMVSTLLANTYGIVDAMAPAEPAPFLRRAVPSAGGLYPLEVFLFARDVDGMADGTYHYEVIGHQLELMKPGDPFASLEPMLYTHTFVTGANLIVAFGAVFGRSQKKYGPRGYRYILLEAGHAAQNLCMTATSLGLATLCMGGFIDSLLNAHLGLDEPEEGIVYTVAVGRRQNFTVALSSTERPQVSNPASMSARPSVAK